MPGTPRDIARRRRQRRRVDVISNTADYSAKLTANFNYFAINRRGADPRGLSAAACTIRALTQLPAGGGWLGTHTVARRRTMSFFATRTQQRCWRRPSKSAERDFPPGCKSQRCWPRCRFTRARGIGRHARLFVTRIVICVWVCVCMCIHRWWLSLLLPDAAYTSSHAHPTDTPLTFVWIYEMYVWRSGWPSRGDSLWLTLPRCFCWPRAFRCWLLW